MNINFLQEFVGGMIMSLDASQIHEFQARIRELEDKIEALRISRRVLMNLLDTLEREKTEQVSKLESQNEKLQKNNYRYARAIMYNNVRITQLEKQLQILSAEVDKIGHTST